MTPEDKHLILRAIRGEPDAINQLAARYAVFINRSAQGIVRNSADAADVTQEVLLKVVRSLHTLERAESFQAWLYRTTYRLSLNWLRARGKLRFTGDERLEKAAAADSDGEFDRKDQLAHIARAAESLPYSLRLIIKMFYYEERSCREIAAILETSEGAVKVQLHRARALMRTMIEDSGSAPEG